MAEPKQTLPDKTSNKLSCKCDKHFIHVLQSGSFVNAYCTKCGDAATVHIDHGGRDLLARKKSDEAEKAIDNVRFSTSKLEEV